MEWVSFVTKEGIKFMDKYKELVYIFRAMDVLYVDAYAS